MQLAFLSDFFSTGNLVLWGCLAFGLSAGLLSPFVLLRTESFFADAVAHTSLFGIAFMLAVAPLLLLLFDSLLSAAGLDSNGLERNNFLRSVYLSFLVFVGALAAAILAAWSVSKLRRYTKLKNDAILAVVFSSYFALGLMILSRIIHTPFFEYAKAELRAEYSFGALRRYLLGNPASISLAELFFLLLLMIFLCGYVALFRRKLAILCFDVTLAKLLGLNTRSLDLWFSLVLCTAVAVSLPFMGVVLVSCMFVAPALAARVLVKRFTPLILLSCFFSLLATLGGSLIGSTFSRFSEASATALLICSLTILLLLAYKIKQALRSGQQHQRPKQSYQGSKKNSNYYAS